MLHDGNDLDCKQDMRISRSNSDVGRLRNISLHDGYQPFRRQGSRESSGSDGKGSDHKEFDSRIFRRSPDKQVTFQDERQTSPPRMQHNRDGMQPYRRPNQRQNRRSWDSDIENQLPPELKNNPLLQSTGGQGRFHSQNNRNDGHWDQHDRRSNHHAGNDRNWGQYDKNDRHWDQHDRRGNFKNEQENRGSNYRGRGRSKSFSEEHDRQGYNGQDRRRNNNSSHEYNNRESYNERGNNQRRDYDRRDNYRDIREQYRKGDNFRDRQSNPLNGQGPRGSMNGENRPSPEKMERSLSREDGGVEVSCLV